MSERQRAFTIKTNKLSQTVYDKLEEKAKGRQLGDYIEALVLRDILEKPASDVVKTHEMLQRIEDKLQSLQVLSFKEKNEHTTTHYVEDKRDVGTGEKDISINLDDVEGDLDDEDLEEYSDF
jgi:hypothetical protein